MNEFVIHRNRISMESQTSIFDRGMPRVTRLTPIIQATVDTINEKEGGAGMRVPRFIKGSRKKEQVGHRPPAALSFLGQKGDLVVSPHRRPRPFPLFPWTREGR